MGKYKICPLCNKHNAPILMECIDCETDLTGVRVVDAKNEDIKDIINEKKELARICDCGYENPSSYRKCINCGEDISDIIPKEKLECNNKAPIYTLVSINDDFTFTITKDVHTLGREEEMSEYLNSKTYVSRIHAKITIVNNELFITNISGTNFTYVNNEKIIADTPYLLHEGDEIGLGGFLLNGQRQENAAYFIVRNCKCM